MNPTRVLLVDDHALVRAGIRALISMIEGVEVVGETGDGDEALRLVEKLHPELVLLDITLPGMNGLTVLSEITARFPDVRVIMLTMHEAREYAIQALRGGAAGFIPKSAASAELTQAIHTVMRGKTYVSSETAQDGTLLTERAAREQELLEKLTPRQREILVLIAEGKSMKQIARLFAHPSNVGGEGWFRSGRQDFRPLLTKTRRGEPHGDQPRTKEDAVSGASAASFFYLKSRPLVQMRCIMIRKIRSLDSDSGNNTKPKA